MTRANVTKADVTGDNVIKAVTETACNVTEASGFRTRLEHIGESRGCEQRQRAV